jgi:hypothetical protein
MTNNLSVCNKAGNVLGIVSLSNHTLDLLSECHVLIIELYGRTRTICRLYLEQNKLLLTVLKGEPEVTERLDYSVLSTALERAPTNGCPLRIYFQDVIEDHNIRNI